MFDLDYSCLGALLLEKSVNGLLRGVATLLYSINILQRGVAIFLYTINGLRPWVVAKSHFFLNDNASINPLHEIKKATLSDGFSFNERW